MENPKKIYWKKRLNDLKLALEANNFAVFKASTAIEAQRVVIEEILPTVSVTSITFGGSMTLVASGLYDYFKTNSAYEVIDTFDRSISKEASLERRRQALLSDLFLTGTNAVVETGQLVNLDMIGNRIGGITFGPKHVVILVGRNKLVASLDEAMFRIKNYVAPVNAMRLGMKTPCTKTSICEECKSPARICNTWTITEKSFPKDRIKIVLIDEDLGL